jgi:hypothetical protein
VRPALPLLGLVACGLLAVEMPENAAASAGHELSIALECVWPGVAGQAGVFTRISHYGFALAMPAFAGAVYLLVWLLPALLEQRYRVRFHWFRMTPAWCW